MAIPVPAIFYDIGPRPGHLERHGSRTCPPSKRGNPRFAARGSSKQKADGVYDYQTALPFKFARRVRKSFFTPLYNEF